MISLKYIERGEKDTVVLIPGWATDYKIFASLDIKFNYLLPIGFSPFSFEKNLLRTLRKYKIAKISLLGWSLGGFWAVEFAAKYTHLINELILVSIRKSYKAQEIARIKSRLRKNKKQCLYEFYSRCFYRQDRLYWFRENFLKSYYRELDLDYLSTTLDYLKDREINPQALRGITKIKIVHGEFDRVAPIVEAIDIKNSLPRAKFILIKDTGHMPFLGTDFNKYI